MLNLSQRKPVVEAEPEYQSLLADLQCNILSGNGCANTHYFFLRFPTGNAELVTSVLRALASGSKDLPVGLHLSSELCSRANHPAHEQEVWQENVANLEPRSFWTNLFLSARCYADFLGKFAKPPDVAFNDGMAERDARIKAAHKLNDAKFITRGRPVHAVYAVGYNRSLPEQRALGSNADEWPRVREQILLYLRGKGVDVREEAGYVLRRPVDPDSRERNPQKPPPIEPFGYRDSISQPLFYKADLDWRRARDEGEAASVQGGSWSSFATLATVLVADPNGIGGDACGSYVVYRKLRQKVDVFYRQAGELATAMSKQGSIPLTGDDVADRLMGRHVDGRPLDAAPNKNDYTYPTPSACPFFAHARKVNPRDAWARSRRIVRRSTVFGPRLVRDKEGRPTLNNDGVPLRADGEPVRETPEDAVGLLFFCCQADIANQFEAIQAGWANDPGSGADTVIGQLPAGEHNRIGLNGNVRSYSYAPVVELLDGEYFFAPSLSFFFRL